MAELNWAVKSTVDFNEKRLFDSLCKQIESVSIAINYIIRSVCDIRSLNSMVKLMINFYDLLRHFFSIVSQIHLAVANFTTNNLFLKKQTEHFQQVTSERNR